MRGPTTMAWFAACAGSLLLVTGCAHDGFDGRTFRSGNVAFELRRLPSSWREISITDTAVAFRDPEHDATVAVNGRCGKDADDAPLKSLTQHLFIHFSEREIFEQRVVALAGREALVTDLRAKLDGVPKYFRVVVLKKDGCVYDFMLIAGRNLGETQLAEFEGFVQGFATLES